MRCRGIRKTMGQEGIDATVREHLAACAECAAWARDWEHVRQGLHLLAKELGPEPTLGFAERLVRRLGEIGEAGFSDSALERVGLRVVYATLLVTLALLLALILPSSGPIRAQAGTELYPSETEIVRVEYDPALAGEAPSNHPLSPANLNRQANEGRK